MTDFSPTTAQLPSLTATIVSFLSRDALKALAAAMVASGALIPSQVSPFISIGLGIAMWGATMAWSAIEKVSNHKTAQVAVAQAKAS